MPPRINDRTRFNNSSQSCNECCALRAGLKTARRTDDAELLNPKPQRIGMKAESVGRILLAVDSPAALPEHRLDVGALQGFQRSTEGQRGRRRTRVNPVVQLKGVPSGSNQG